MTSLRSALFLVAGLRWAVPLPLGIMWPRSQTTIGANWFRVAKNCPGRGPAEWTWGSSARQENVLDVRVRAKPGAEQLIVRFPKPSGHFPAHIHLDQCELLEIPLVDSVEVGGGKTDCRAVLDCTDRGAARKAVHD